MGLYTQVDKRNLGDLKRPYLTHTCNILEAIAGIDAIAACNTLTLTLNEIGTPNEIGFKIMGGKVICDFYKGLAIENPENLLGRKVLVVQGINSRTVEGIMPYRPLNSNILDKQDRVA